MTSLIEEKRQALLKQKANLECLRQKALATAEAAQVDLYYVEGALQVLVTLTTPPPSKHGQEDLKKDEETKQG